MSRLRPWADVEAVLKRTKEMLHKDTLSEEWRSLAAQATKDAQSDLIQILTNRGYSYQSIAAWDSAETYAERLAVYYTLMRGAALASYDLKAVEALDPTKFLMGDAVITVGGQPILPDGLLAGVQYGRIDLDDIRRRAAGFFR